MKKLIIVACGIGLLAAIFWVGHPRTPQPLPSSPEPTPVGASASTEHYNPEYFRNSIASNSYNCLSSVSSSTTGASVVNLGAGTCGQMTVGTGTPYTAITSASAT